MSPDPFPSFDLNPVVVTDAMDHAFVSIGNCTIALEVSEDGGLATLILDVIIRFRTSS
ncbi:MAG: hypothetical protein LN415_03230 [Candidatus Thermoplasmatota archaeon]|nr:hypothetical protein [Candidatus Thermoplasmatota archaeon]